MTSYKDQFTEWSPAYPVVFHGLRNEAKESCFNDFIKVRGLTLRTHNITINAINKAMKK